MAERKMKIRRRVRLKRSNRAQIYLHRKKSRQLGRYYLFFVLKQNKLLFDDVF